VSQNTRITSFIWFPKHEKIPLQYEKLIFFQHKYKSLFNCLQSLNEYWDYIWGKDQSLESAINICAFSSSESNFHIVSHLRKIFEQKNFNEKFPNIETRLEKNMQLLDGKHNWTEARDNQRANNTQCLIALISNLNIWLFTQKVIPTGIYRTK
jgi:hypothetical protein